MKSKEQEAGGGAAAAPTVGGATTLLGHMAAGAAMQGVVSGVTFMLPMIAGKNYHASPWASMLITAGPQVLMVLSLFWGDLLRQMPIGRYLRWFWLVSAAPMLLVPLVDQLWLLIGLHLLCAVGSAGWANLNGELLKRFYSDARRGRAYATISAAMLASGALATLGLGRWLEADPEAYRIYMPLTAALQLAGAGLLAWLARRTGAEAARTLLTTDRGEGWHGVYRRVIEPIGHMREVLRADPVFYRYEAAFMTYGVGWMVCFALVPLLVVNKLGLPYRDIAVATHVPFLLATLAMTFPAGWLLDRLGAMRVASLSFGLYALYPLGLMFAGDVGHMVAASLLYGVCSAGVSVAWMLGPVNLAPSPEKVPQYVAIHATLVGLRGAVFQFLGVALYTLTNDFAISFGVAAAGFLWASWQMRALARLVGKAPGGALDGGQTGSQTGSQIGGQGGSKTTNVDPSDGQATVQVGK